METNGRVSPHTLSVAAEFSLKRANRQLLAMGETLESAKSELSPTSANFPSTPTSRAGAGRSHSRSSSAPITPVHKDGYGGSGDMLSDMRKLAVELRTLRESIDPARRSSVSSISSRVSTPLTSPRNTSRLRLDEWETPRTSPRHSRHSSLTGLKTVREEQPVIEVSTMRGSAVGQPSAVVRIFRSTPRGQPTTNGHLQTRHAPHYRSLSESSANGIHVRQYDYSQEVYSPKTPIPEFRPKSEQSMLSESSYHSAVQGLSDSDSDINGHISDTATVGAPTTPIPPPSPTRRDIGVNTEDILPAEIPAQTLRQRPSRAALLSNIRGCQDGILLARLHAAVDKLAHELASSPDNPDDSDTRRKLQSALDLLENVSE
jgi:hypothetical protein